MEINSEEIARRYAAMTDYELDRVDRRDLTSEAGAIFDEEVRRRGTSDYQASLKEQRERASREFAEAQERSKKARVQLNHVPGQLTWPRMCACCGTSDVELRRMEVSATLHRSSTVRTTYKWTVPYCGTCKTHANAYILAYPSPLGVIKSLFAAGMTSVIVGVILDPKGNSPTFSGTLGVVLGLFVYFVILRPYAISKSRRFTTPGCAASGPAVTYSVYAAGNAAEFQFANLEYAAAFRNANHFPAL